MKITQPLLWFWKNLRFFKCSHGPVKGSLALKAEIYIFFAFLSVSFIFFPVKIKTEPSKLGKKKSMITKSLTKRESEDIFLKIPINCKNENDQPFITSISKSTSSSYAARDIKKKNSSGIWKVSFLIG